MLLHVTYVTFALAWQDHSPDVHTTNDTTASSSSSTDESSRSTDHTIRYDTWVGYNSTWKYFKVRASYHVPCCYSCTPVLTHSSYRACADVDGRDTIVV